MDLEIEKYVGGYPTIDEMFSIWGESLSDFDNAEVVRQRLDWAYHHNVSGKGRLWLLRDQKTGKYFGCSALLPRHFYLKGKKVLGAIIADTAVKKEYRTLGPALKLHREVLKSSQEFELIIAFPNTISEAILKAVGFKVATNLIHVIKVLKSDLVIENEFNIPIISKFLSPFFSVVDLGLKLMDIQPLAEKKFNRIFIESFDPRFDEIWSTFRNKYDFIIDRRSDYLSWRYVNNPFKNYRIYVLHNKGSEKILGYVVYTKRNNSLFVDDFMWVDEHLNPEILISFFIKDIRKTNIKSISFFAMENSKIHKSFEKKKFYKIKKKLPVMFFANDKSIELNSSDYFNNPFITYGDNDF